MNRKLTPDEIKLLVAIIKLLKLLQEKIDKVPDDVGEAVNSNYYDGVKVCGEIREILECFETVLRQGK